MKLLLTVITLSMFTTGSALQLDSLISQGNRYYETEDYEQAITRYLQADSLIESADLDHNLGNAYYKDNQLGKAVLHYERALMLKPGNEDIRYNLELARNLTVDKLDDSSENAFSIWWRATLLKIGMDRLAYLSILAAFLTALGWILFRASSTRNRRQLGFTIGTGLGIVTIALMIASLHAKSSIVERNSGIILSKRVSVMSAPDEGSTELFILHEGSKVAVESERGAWTNVSIPNGNKGWMKSYEVEGI
jgi:tetratricopeptide (TPR) repeat protein